MSADIESVADDGLEFRLTRVYDAPRELVFAMWVEPQHFNKWCHVKDHTVADSGGDVRPGGVWHSVIRAPGGTDHRMEGEYREIVENERLVFTHVWVDDDGTPGVERLITITLADTADGKTELTFHEASFDDVVERDSNQGGWAQVLESLANNLGG